MRNSKLVTLDLMHVDALTTTDLVSTTGGKTIFNVTIDAEHGTFGEDGKRKPVAYGVTKIDVGVSDLLAQIGGQYLLSKFGGGATAPKG